MKCSVKFKCEHCDYKATNNNGHFSHTINNKSVHQCFKFACGKCDYKSTRTWFVMTHEISLNQGVKFSCDQCDFQATTNGALVKHIHRGVKSCACARCIYKEST